MPKTADQISPTINQLYPQIYEPLTILSILVYYYCRQIFIPTKYKDAPNASDLILTSFDSPFGNHDSEDFRNLDS